MRMCEPAGNPTKNLLPDDLCSTPGNMKNKFRNFFMDEDTKGALAVDRQINVRRSEDGLSSRRRLTRHFVKQMETFHVYSVAKLRMPRNKHMFSPAPTSATTAWRCQS